MPVWNDHEEYSGGIFIRSLEFDNPGDTHSGHKHYFDHCTLVVRGAVSVEVEGKVKVYRSPEFIEIKAEKEHSLTAVEPDTLCMCIFAVREPFHQFMAEVASE